MMLEFFWYPKLSTSLDDQFSLVLPYLRPFSHFELFSASFYIQPDTSVPSRGDSLGLEESLIGFISMLGGRLTQPPDGAVNPRTRTPELLRRRYNFKLLEPVKVCINVPLDHWKPGKYIYFFKISFLSGRICRALEFSFLLEIERSKPMLHLTQYFQGSEQTVT